LLGIKLLAGNSSEKQFRKDWIPDEVVPEIYDTALSTSVNNSVLVQTNLSGKTKKKKTAIESTTTATTTTTTTTTTSNLTATPRLEENESTLVSAKEGQQPAISKTVPADLQKGSKTKIYETVKSAKGVSEYEKKKKSIYDIGSTSESRSLLYNYFFMVSISIKKFDLFTNNPTCILNLHKFHLAIVI
jgi:hypothetical protein